MDIFEEPIHYQNPALCIKVWQFVYPPKSEARINDTWHHHKEIECILVQQGELEFHTANRIYHLKPSDVVIVGSSQLHRSYFVGKQGLDHIVLHVDLEPYFDPAMMMYYQHFSEIHHPLEELNYIFAENKGIKEEVGRILVDIHEEMMGKTHGYEIAASMLIKRLLLTLLRGDRLGKLQAHEFVDAQLMKPILQYVDLHLANKISMEKVSQMAGMSYFYFSKYFKKAMGASFTDYINRKRIAKAERLLITTQHSVTDIASQVGIENMAHFYEMFKRFNHCTPKQYIQKLKSPFPG